MQHHTAHAPAAPASLADLPGPELIVLLQQQQLSAWQLRAGTAPTALRIKGETQLPLRDPSSLSTAFTDLQERLRGDGIAHTQALWIADAPGRAWCEAAQLAPWQLPLEWLAQHFAWEMGTESVHTLVQNQALPWLVPATDRALRQQLQQARQHEHRTESERLAQERLALEQDNARLRAQNQALQQLDAEQLACFLPALYPRVFTVIGPSDLALLCGRLTPLALPNPYPEPVEETLRVLQKRFRALPSALQQQIVSFLADLPHSHKLQPRPEMRDWIETLKAQ